MGDYIPEKGTCARGFFYALNHGTVVTLAGAFFGSGFSFVSPLKGGVEVGEWIVSEQVGLGNAFKSISFDARLGIQASDLTGAVETTRFFVIRHGESLGQIDKTVYKTPRDALIPLTLWGAQQSCEAGKFLREFALANGLGNFNVLHSTCLRTRQTAGAIIDGLGIDKVACVRPDILLDKQRFGRFSGLFDDEEKMKLDRDLFLKYQSEIREKGAFKARPPGGESLHDVQDNVNRCLEEILHRKSGTKNIILVTHGTPALCVENRLLNRGSAWVLDNLDRTENCSIRLIENSTGVFNAETLGSGVRRPSGLVTQACADPFLLTL